MNELVEVRSAETYKNGDVGGMVVHFAKAGQTLVLPRRIVRYLVQDAPNNFTVNEIPQKKVKADE